LGEVLREAERRVIADALEDVFGLQLLQIGSWGEPGHLVEAARTQRSAVIGSGAALGAQIQSKASELAVASDSVDAVLLPHTLEFEPDPYAVVREVERILIAEGQLIVLGFAPFGPWGLRHRAGIDGFPPGMARLISERRLREWLALLGFEVGSAVHYLRRLPWTSGRPVDRDGGRGPWFLPTSAYLLKARKRVYTVTPMRLYKRERRVTVGGLEPTANRQPSASAARLAHR
jgi:SAM-dependent methyltransferase